MTAGASASANWPRVSTIGTDGLLVSFGDRLSEPANRAALVFRAALSRAGIPGLEETATSLASAYVRFDPAIPDRKALVSAVERLAADRDWYGENLPEGRRLWRIPTVFGTALAPQLDEAAAMAGLSTAQAVQSITAAPVRVLTLGFGPGQPYLGELPQEWDIPRQKTLTERVPVGALTVAIRQLVLFSIASPTGWRHVGQTAFRPFRPEAEAPFALRPGDEVLFAPVEADRYAELEAQGADGGATSEAVK